MFFLVMVLRNLDICVEKNINKLFLYIGCKCKLKMYRDLYKI